MQSAVKVTELARRYSLAPNVVFARRRLAREGRLGGEAGLAFIPVEIHLSQRNQVLHRGTFAWTVTSMLRRCWSWALTALNHRRTIESFLCDINAEEHRHRACSC